MSSILLFLLIALTSTYLAEAGKPQYSLGEAEKLFEEFVVKHKKAYKSEAEKQMRFDNFKRWLKKINEKNANEDDTVVHGINQFSDMTEEEIKKITSSLNVSTISTGSVCVQSRFAHNKTLTAADAVDWRQKGVVSPVKNQQSCGSCWAFSSTGHLESQYAIKHGQILDLSEQQLVDCDSGSQGCSGGNMPSAFSHVKQGGIMSEQTYPYENVQSSCREDPSQAVVKVTECQQYMNPTEEQLTELVSTKGPISIALCTVGWETYSSGIFSSPCTGINHAVLVVGYGEEQGVQFWIVKNSWNTTWGEQGYIRLLRGSNTSNYLNDFMSSADVA